MRISDWSSDVCSSDLRIYAKVGPVRGQRGAMPVKNPAAAGGDEREVDAVAFGFELIFLVLEDSEIAHSRGQQHTEPALHRSHHQTAPVEAVAPGAGGRMALGKQIGRAHV